LGNCDLVHDEKLREEYALLSLPSSTVIGLVIDYLGAKKNNN
jgi:hypothetical protein